MVISGNMVDWALVWAYVGGAAAGTFLAVVTFLSVRAVWKLTR
jgi:hypothetical protein